MNYLPAGQFYGQTSQRLDLNGLTITDTEYSYEFIDWHYHRHSHFELTMRGHTRAGNRRETYQCAADTLLFHNAKEPHYNVKPAGITRGFQLEITPEWSRQFDVDPQTLPDSAMVLHPGVKLLFYNVYKEAKRGDDVSGLSIDALLLDMLASMGGAAARPGAARPVWVKTLDELLRENYAQPPSLQTVAAELDLHWAHLSREFPRYFQCTFGAYIRKIRVGKSLALLRDKNLSLTDIALQCGFADQSHDIRCFREFMGVTPKAFRKLNR
ncbi:MAG: AraC family transcriptional regulator [Blastocatellia bacterium]